VYSTYVNWLSDMYLVLRCI